jgi:iron complex transport system ATP-binding protein
VSETLLEPKNLLELRNVSVVRTGRTIVADVSLGIVPGEVFALVGPNGAGKSTLLGAFSGEITPATGQALINGVSAHHYRPKALSQFRAILLQSNQVSFPFTVAQVVEMGRNPWVGTAQADDDEASIARAMDSVGVVELASRRFGELSGGEKARVSLARVLAQDTDVLLLDEPTAALDLHHQDRVMRVIRKRARVADDQRPLGGSSQEPRPRAVVVVVHDLSLAAAYADRVGLLVGGALVAVGTPEEVMTKDILSDAYKVSLDVTRAPDGNLMVVPTRGVID